MSRSVIGAMLLVLLGSIGRVPVLGASAVATGDEKAVLAVSRPDADPVRAPNALRDCVRQAYSLVLVSKEGESTMGLPCQTRFRVDRLLYGADPGSSAITILSGGLEALRMRDTSRALLLLGPDGTPASPEFPFLPLSPHVGFLSPSPDREETIGRYLAASITPEAPVTVLEACIGYVCELGVSKAADSLRRLTESQDRTVVGWGLVGLAGLGDRRVFPTATWFLLDGDDAARPLRGQLIAKIAACIKDPSLAGYLIPILASKEAAVRGWAIRALRAMRTPAAVPCLVAALDDPELQNRFGALMALASTLWQEQREHHLPAVAIWAFERDPDRYTRPWRDWWEREGKAKYGKGAGK